MTDAGREIGAIGNRNSWLVVFVDWNEALRTSKLIQKFGNPDESAAEVGERGEFGGC